MRLRRFPPIGAVALVAAAAAFGPGAWASHVAPVVYGDEAGEENNPSCAFLNPSWNELKVNEAPNGIHNDLGAGDNPGGPGPLVVTITGSDGKVFDWQSNVGIDALVVKGGDRGSNVYLYGTETTTDQDVRSPNNRKGAVPDVSHVSACYDTDPLPSTAEGTKFEDLNGNGAKETGEPGLSGWTIFVDLDGDGGRDGGEPSATTGANGNYRITDIPSGSYKIREVQRDGWRCTAPNPCEHAESFSAGSSKTGKNFGNFELASVSGTVFDDADGDGTRDPGEGGLPGWTVFVDTNGNGGLDSGESSTSTGPNGGYEIGGIGPGSFDVRQVDQPDWACTAPAPCRHAETFASGDEKTGRDFGNRDTTPVTQEPADDDDEEQEQGGGDGDGEQQQGDGGGGEQQQGDGDGQQQGDGNGEQQGGGGEQQGDGDGNSRPQQDGDGGEQQRGDGGDQDDGTQNRGDSDREDDTGGADQPRDDGGETDDGAEQRSGRGESENGEQRDPQADSAPEDGPGDDGDGDVLGESESDSGDDVEEETDESDDDEDDDGRRRLPFTGSPLAILLVAALTLLMTGLAGRRAGRR